jgi:subtilisin family serine protease
MANNKHTGVMRIVRFAAAVVAAAASSWITPSIAAKDDPVTYVGVVEANAKLSPDLRDAIVSTSLAPTNWIREAPTGRLLKLLVLSCDEIDPDLTALRQAVVAAGGSVYYRFASVNGLLVMLPASKVVSIAQRSDVEAISPNRLTTRTASFLEQVTGAAGVRALPAGYDGSGVGIAVLDSGVMASHKAFAGANGGSRVKKSVNLRKLGASLAALWDAGKDYGSAIEPGTPGRQALETLIDSSSDAFQDPFGHGTMVASVAAGRAVPGPLNTTGIAPGAALVDVRVLNDMGMGEVADALAAFDWVLFHAQEYNIRVVNVSFAADSTTSYLVDPLCRAVRNTVASGIVVVVAAGNFGLEEGVRTFGTISSPGDEPSAITVASVNPHATVTRADDSVNMFSSRGPTRGATIDDAGVRHPDNLLKPDLAAPGNAVIGAMSSDNTGTTLNAIVQSFPQLIAQAPAGTGTGLMQLSGTSIAAPVISGTVALMLQANPGLTPPIVKAMLQYTAQPLPGFSLLDQGSGLVNALGAVQLAGVVVPDLSTRMSHGNSLKAGDSILVKGKSVPPPSSIVGGTVVPWSGFVFLGGARVLGGTDLFAKWQPVYDPTLTWVGQRVRSLDIEYFDKKSASVEGVVEQAVDSKKKVTLVTPGVVDVSMQLGVSSLLMQTGAFTPSTVVMDKVGLPGSGLSAGIVISDGVVTADSIVLAEGIVMPESIVLAESIVLSEGIMQSESLVLAESGPLQSNGGGAVFAGEP